MLHGLYPEASLILQGRRLLDKDMAQQIHSMLGDADEYLEAGEGVLELISSVVDKFKNRISADRVASLLISTGEWLSAVTEPVTAGLEKADERWIKKRAEIISAVSKETPSQETVLGLVKIREQSMRRLVVQARSIGKKTS